MMKKNKQLLIALLLGGTALGFSSCSDDEGGSTGFKQVYATLDEGEGGSVTIPTSGSISESDLVFEGTATEGEDYTVDISGKEITITVVDDEDFEGTEIANIRIKGASANGVLKVTIYSDCDYTAADFDADSFSGSYSAIEDYGDDGTYGPYHTAVIQDEENPNLFEIDNFYDNHYHATILFNGADGTVAFPDGQSPGDEDIEDSTGTFDACTGELTINLTYDGSTWVYRLKKDAVR